MTGAELEALAAVVEAFLPADARGKVFVATVHEGDIHFAFPGRHAFKGLNELLGAAKNGAEVANLILDAYYPQVTVEFRRFCVTAGHLLIPMLANAKRALGVG